MQREFPSAPLVGVGAVIVEDVRVLLVRRGTEPLKAIGRCRAVWLNWGKDCSMQLFAR